MSGTSGISHVPVVVTHDPLGRAMTEEQKQRLREQADPPVEEASAKERLQERRRDDSRRRSPPDEPAEAAAPGEAPRHPAPGSLVDSYV